MEGIQLELDTYAGWLAQVEKWRLTEDDMQLLRQSYLYTSKRDRERLGEMPDEMRYVRNTKAREWRRVNTFERYLRRLAELKVKAQRARGEHSRQTVRQIDDELTKAMKNRHRNIAGRASARGLPFNLTVDYLKALANCTNVCPINLTPLVYYGDDANAELDRHIPELGYVQGNVNFLSSKANRQKSDLTKADLERLLIYLS